MGLRRKLMDDVNQSTLVTRTWRMRHALYLYVEAIWMRVYSTPWLAVASRWISSDVSFPEKFRANPPSLEGWKAWLSWVGNPSQEPRIEVDATPMPKAQFNRKCFKKQRFNHGMDRLSAKSDSMKKKKDLYLWVNLTRREVHIQKGLFFPTVGQRTPTTSTHRIG